MTATGQVGAATSLCDTNRDPLPCFPFVVARGVGTSGIDVREERRSL